MAVSASFHFAKSLFSYHSIIMTSHNHLGTVDVNGFNITKRKHVSSMGLQVNDPPAKVINATRASAIDWNTPLPTTKAGSSKPTTKLEEVKQRNPKIMDSDDLGVGRMVKEGFVYRQNFDIRSYEIGPDQTASIETIMNHMQETTLNHLKAIGLLGDGYGSTPEMCKKNLIWVMVKMQVVVDRYPIWGGVVQIDAWKAAYRKNGLGGNWIFYDCKTGEMLIRASSIWVMMNTETRRISRFPDEVRAEIQPVLLDTPPAVEEQTIKWSKRDYNIVPHVRNGLMPRWSDVDVNQHVNNTKYIGLLLESVPKTIMKNYELASMTLEYCRECEMDSVLQSHTYVIGTNDVDNITDHHDHVDCEHLLQLDNLGVGSEEEIMKGRTTWRLK
uniref:palmitoyl-acyl carrier protein thioesterase, chloroplastic-like n=1 Tax=Erigeron canadensis TaxID=72917 RepID=UPI001CB98B69|nr:palmitoyl-acyl carrier protein thioesterase, chloroplastic-like [Erigeron canadensis]